MQSKPLGATAKRLKHRLRSFGEEARESDLVEIVMEALQTSEASVLIQSNQPENGADLAIWNDELDAWGANPLLVEIKSQISADHSMETILSEVSHYLQQSGSRYALILYTGNLPAHAQKRVLPHNILLLETGDFLEKLQRQTLGQVLRDQRNRQIHASAN